MGHKLNFGNMHIFGTACYTYIQGRKKLDTKCKKAIFIGYDESCLSNIFQKLKRSSVRCAKFTEILKLLLHLTIFHFQLKKMQHYFPTIWSKILVGRKNKSSIKQPDNPPNNMKNNWETSNKSYKSRLQKVPEYLNDYVC